MKKVRKEDLDVEFLKLLYWLHNLLHTAPDNFEEEDEIVFRDLLNKFRRLNMKVLDLNKYYDLGCEKTKVERIQRLTSYFAGK